MSVTAGEKERGIGRIMMWKEPTVSLFYSKFRDKLLGLQLKISLIIA